MTQNTLPVRRLGTLEVSAIGLGCMPMSWGYSVGEADPAEIRATLHRAVEIGVTLLDTADVYGPFTNEEIIGKYVVGDGLRERVVIASKCGLVPVDSQSYGRDGSPTHVKLACEASLRRLGTDYLDLFQLHRVDPDVPIEETWGAMAELVSAGKVRHIGLSEVTVEEIQRAQSVHPVASVQSELSIWTSENIDNDVLDFCNTNDIGFLAYSPLGRGFLTGELDGSTIGDDDFRKNNPRFSAEAMAANQAIVDGIALISERHSATPAQIALAWILAQGENVVPIPGTKRRKWLEQNVASVDITLASEDLVEIAALPASIAPRY